MKEKLYIVASNLVPMFKGTRTECEKYLKTLKKEDRSNPYYRPSFKPNYYCGKRSKFSIL